MSRCKSLFLTLLAVALLGLPAAWAQDNGQGAGLEKFNPADVEQVRLLLSGYHGLPDEGSLRSVKDAHEIIQVLATSDGLLIRDRALAALGNFWPSADVYLLYANVLADPKTPDATRHRVMILAAEVFGDRAVPVIKPYLTSNDVQLRLTAVEALGRVRTEEVVAILESHAEKETNAIVLERIDKASRILR